MADEPAHAVDRSTSAFINSARWLAAAAIVTGHIRAVIFMDYCDLSSPGIIDTAFYLLTSLGRQAVVVFLVLSGFLVGGNVIRGVRGGAFRFGRYIEGRVTRLYPAFLAALLAGFVLDHLGMMYLGQAQLYSPDRSFNLVVLASFDPSTSLSLETFLYNLVMCQTILAPAYGTNGPLWFLSHVFWCCMLFPLLVRVCIPHTALSTRLLSLVLAILFVVLMPRRILFHFAIWGLGVVARIVHRTPMPIPLSLVACGVALVVTLTGNGGQTWLEPDLTFGIAFALLLNSLDNRSWRCRLPERLDEFMAGFSYSLYVFHFPFCIFMISGVSWLLGTVVKVPPSPLAYCVFFVVLTATYAYSLGMAALSEWQTPKIRTALLTVTKGLRARFDKGDAGHGRNEHEGYPNVGDIIDEPQ